MLKGVKVKSISRFTDERGFFCEAMRTDWIDLFDRDIVAQINHSFTYPGIVRAWHRHLRGQIDYFLVLKGAAKICVFDDETEELTEIISTGLDLQVVRIPGHYWHGFKAVGIDPTMLIYYTTKLYESKNPDEERREWNDPTLIPKKINGTVNDERVGKSWNWDHSPNK